MADEITLATLARAARNDDAQLDIQKAAETATLTFTAEERQQIDKIKGELDLRESVTAVEFGIGSQRKLAEFADLVLDNSTKDSADIAGQLGTKPHDSAPVCAADEDYSDGKQRYVAENPKCCAEHNPDLEKSVRGGGRAFAADCCVQNAARD